MENHLALICKDCIFNEGRDDAPICGHPQGPRISIDKCARRRKAAPKPPADKETNDLPDEVA